MEGTLIYYSKTEENIDDIFSNSDKFFKNLRVFELISVSLLARQRTLAADASSGNIAQNSVPMLSSID